MLKRAPVAYNNKIYQSSSGEGWNPFTKNSNLVPAGGPSNDGTDQGGKNLSCP